MIYLIDDKQNRQKSYRWNEEKFAKHINFVTPIYSQNDIEQNDFLCPDNCVLFHESFFDQSVTYRHKSVEIRERLIEYAAANPKFLLAIFSGSKNSRSRNGNVIHIPVNVLYQNLEDFINKYEHGNIDLGFLLFGKDPKIEEDLLIKLQNSVGNFDESTNFQTNTRNLFIRPNQNFIQFPHPNFDQATLFNKVSDNDISTKIQEWLSDKFYDNIFLPISFGQTLSDFNGLRLAMHIRCTPGLNQLTNIFIYSYLDYSYLISNPYFDILKTMNVEVIGYQPTDFEKAVTNPREPLLPVNLADEIRKIKIDPPKNYTDSHSIANEWAVYRWAHALNASDDSINNIEQNVSSNLYFKYLATIYPSSEITPIRDSDLKIKTESNPNILYVDDEADKGWFEIFSKILVDINGFEEFQYLDNELDGKPKDQIIKLVTDLVKSDDIDIVILDYRLHPDDFEEKDFHEITGLQLLKAIKNINPGIQVILFSATNKVWNLQAMQEAGADGFIIKESPENSLTPDFTIELIKSFKKSIAKSIQNTYQKSLFINFDKIHTSLLRCDYLDQTKYDKFLKLLIRQLQSIKTSTRGINSDPSTLDVVFLNCYNYLELYKTHYLSIMDNRYVLGIDEIELNRYTPERNQVYNDGVYIPENSNDKPSWFNALAGVVVDYFELCEVDGSSISDLLKIKNARNIFIHGKKAHFNVSELKLISEIMLELSKSMKE